MKLFVIIFASLILSFSLVGSVKALESTVPFLCIDGPSQDVYWPIPKSPSGYTCQANTQQLDAEKPIPTNSKYACIVSIVDQDSGELLDLILLPEDPFASTASKCKKYEADYGKNIGKYTIFGSTTTFSTAGQTTPTTTTDGSKLNQIKDIDVNSVTPSSSTTNTNKNTSTSTSGTNTSGGTRGDCPENFVEKGPLCVPENPFAKSGGIAGSGSVGELATTIIGMLLMLAGIVAVIMLIIGGYIWMTARGNETQVTNGRKTVINALIGLIIIVLSYAIVQAITNFILKGS